MKALILLYHRVGDPGVDPWNLCVSPERFGEHMEALRLVSFPCSIPQLVRAHAARDIPENAVAVTFDDGYLDNLTNAKPSLEAHDVPAMVYVCSGAIGRNEEFWWDQLVRALLQPKRLPEQLVVDAMGKRFMWNFVDEKCDEDRAKSSDAKFGRAISTAAFMNIWKTLRSLPTAARAESMRQINAWAGTLTDARATHRVLSESDLVTLASGGLVDVGAHTVSHPLLPVHPRGVQCYEIEHSRYQIQEILQRPIEHFAYPYGGYDQTTVDILREVGFTSACTTIDSGLSARCSAYEFPRVTVQNWTGDQFLRIVTRKLSEDLISGVLEVGDEITFPLRTFKTKTGELQKFGLECLPGRHSPGHCLYGLDYVISNAGTYRATFVVGRHDSSGAADAIFDVYENQRLNRVLSESELNAVGEPKSVVVEFFANKGYSIELRVYWRGKSPLTLSEIRLQRCV